MTNKRIAEHKERDRARKKAVYPQRRAILIARTKQWQADNPVLYLVGQKSKHANRRARALGISERITSAEVMALFDGVNWKCAHCRKRFDHMTLSLDHIIPLEANGPNVMANAQALCLACHRLKTAYDTRLVRHMRKLSLSVTSVTEPLLGSE